MSSFFSRLSFRLGHVSDETFAGLLSGELSSYRTMRVNGHLSRCWQCRARRDELERAAQLVVEYRRGNQASCLPLDPNYRRSFLAKVEEEVNTPGAVTHWQRPVLHLGRHLRAMNLNPVIASVVVVAFAGVLLFWIWQRSATTVSARELLRRAEISEEQRSVQHSNGVLYQQVAVRMGKSTIHHSIYRDLSGRRRARPVALSPAEAQVRKTLEGAGIDWNEPLSAKDFSGWHDRQPEPRDEVERTSQSELTVTTTINAGDVAQESLTVRESDFHPIRRVVELRDQETIEIAELDFAVLGWSAVNQALFEFSPGIADSGLAVLPSLHAALPRSLPSAMEIDVAEVSARAALAQLGADAGDQIRITHTDTGVTVKGIVGTNRRKRQLVLRLDAIAYVHPEFLSAEEMQGSLGNGTPSSSRGVSSSSVEMYTASDALAPLAKFLNDMHAQPEQLSATSQLLLNASLRVQQAGAQLLELEDRFTSTSLPDASRAQLESLMASQRKEISAGLDAELSVLSRIGLIDVKAFGEPSPTAVADRSVFRRHIAQNQQYCQELITAPASEPRSASAVAADIQSSIYQIRASLAQMSKPSPQP